MRLLTWRFEDMLGNLFHRYLSLDLGERDVRFMRVQDFEFALASRTEVPAEKVAEMVKLDAGELLDEASRIREAEKQFVDLVARSLEEPGSIGYLLRQVELKQFSQDHGWREIIRSLVEKGTEFNEYKQVAVVKYVQYLGSRQDVLKSLYVRQDNQPRHEESELTMAASEDMRQTLTFDVSDIMPPEETVPESFARIPRGETVTVYLAPGESVDIILSRHRFKLIADGQPRLIDDSGCTYALKAGRNNVGRQAGNDVIVDISFSDVSRRHIVIDVGSAGTFELTDFSSHGTYLPRERLESTFHPMIEPGRQSQ